MSTTKLVSRGYVIAYRTPAGETKLTAVVSGPTAAGLQRRVGGRRINASGLAYRTAQGSLRVLTDPTAALARPTS